MAVTKCNWYQQSTGEVQSWSWSIIRFKLMFATAVYYGDGSNLTNLPAAGITTEAGSASGIVTHVRLSSAQDHKITATGLLQSHQVDQEQRENHTQFVL